MGLKQSPGRTLNEISKHLKMKGTWHNSLNLPARYTGTVPFFVFVFICFTCIVQEYCTNKIRIILWFCLGVLGSVGLKENTFTQFIHLHDDGSPREILGPWGRRWPWPAERASGCLPWLQTAPKGMPPTRARAP